MKHLILVIVWVACIKVCAGARDFQYWNTESFEAGLGADLVVRARTEFRFKEGRPAFFHHGTDLGMGLFSSRRLAFSINYRQVREKKGHRWWREHRPHIGGTIGLGWRSFKLQGRSRLERREWDHKDDTWRYRSKMSVEFPPEWAILGFRPYMADEIFVDREGRGVSQNRLSLGFKVRSKRRLAADAYYLRLDRDRGGRRGSNVLGNGLSLIF